MKHIPLVAKNARVLRIQTEYQSDAKRVQAFQRFRALRILILFQERVIQYADNFPGLQGDFPFFCDVDVLSAHKEIQAVIFRPQIFQKQGFRLPGGTLHVVNMKFLKVTGDNPTRTL